MDSTLHGSRPAHLELSFIFGTPPISGWVSGFTGNTAQVEAQVALKLYWWKAVGGGIGGQRHGVRQGQMHTQCAT